MTTIELEQVIRDYILDIYHKGYIGKLEIQKLNPVGYHISFGMDTPNQPLIIHAELDDEKFIKFLKNELKVKRFNLRQFGKLDMIYPYNQENNSYICDDKRRINRQN